MQRNHPRSLRQAILTLVFGHYGLVASAIGERLRVEQRFAEHLTAGKLEMAARLTNQASIGLSARAQRNQLTDVWEKSVTVQLAVKTAQ